MELTLGDLRFPVAAATMSGGLGDPHWKDTYDGGGPLELGWSIECRTEPREVEGYTWHPRLYCEAFSLPVRSWTDLEGRTVRWDSPCDDTGEPHGGLYVFEHEDITDAVLEFRKRTGAVFGFRWAGHANVFFDERYGERVPFLVEGECTFEGIRAAASGLDTPETVRARLAAVTSLADLDQGRFALDAGRYQDGVAMADMWFQPRPR